MGYWKDVLTGRLSHWSNTAEPVFEKLLRNASNIENDGLASWTVAFVSHWHEFLRQVFFGNPESFKAARSRLKHLTRDSFSSLHAIALIHHVAVCRDDLDDFDEIASGIARVLGMSAEGFSSKIEHYARLQGFEMSVFFYQQIARVLGIAEQDIIGVRIWMQAVVFVAEAAASAANDMNYVVQGLRGDDSSDD